MRMKTVKSVPSGWRVVDFVYLHVVEAAEVSRLLLRERHCDVTNASAAHVRRAVGGATTIVRRLELVAARSPEHTQCACVNTGHRQRTDERSCWLHVYIQ